MTLNNFPSISIVGATGAVGKICLDILKEKKYPSNKINLFASKRSEGKRIQYFDEELVVQEAKKDSFNESNVVFISADSQSSSQIGDISRFKNMGLITPFDILKKISDLSYEKVGLNNYEGFVRQIFGWREFIRYLNVKHYEDFHQNNFFKNNRKLSKHWYDGTTSIPILNESIHILKSNGYVHHIPRLMVLSNIMNLCGINPQEVYKWFMETFIDSSDWVMTPNVFGMGLFSDGGIFATKPYICGSNYLLKMSNYTKGDWTKTMDGLYWNFIFNNKDYFKSNHRLSMMYYSINKMDKDKLSNHLQNAKIFIETYTK